ncbi:hypothetical protein CN899_22015 [Bacillus thuringiensis]|uniref:ATP-dependent helicase n=1 Tax=Bacillus thuringiensis TaxID=1428 RepID=A0A9X7BWD9_BACTU|nr:MULTISPECIES: hypothetical protein [Bacillus cereus group]ALC52366.1 hypothetical protein ACN91_12490 [Bacillus cereus]PGH80394.1 hypothetical protein CN899_22015 [Bacillus thuringiensis]
MHKYICIRESFDWIWIGGNRDELTQKEYDLLVRYLENNIGDNKEIIQNKYRKLRFINYVGIINIENVTIEIIPKISLSNDKNIDKQILLRMLSKCSDLELNLDKEINSKIRDSNLLELLAHTYVHSLLKELNKGLYYEYINKEENLNVIRGKLLLNKHVKYNYANKVRAYNTYSEYSSDNILNQIFKLACIRILNKVYNNKITNKIKKVLFDLSNVDVININREVLERLKLNRHNKRFSSCFELAKFILLNVSNESSIGSSSGFTMLFEINTLYEKYIGYLMKEIWRGQGKKVILQDNSKFLLLNTETKRKNFNLKPDIVLADKNECQIIIDTKWKAVEYKSKSSFKVEDVYQMYAYISSYQEAKKAVLLYPCLIKEKVYPIWDLLNHKGKQIEVRTVRLDSYRNTLNDLREIIGDN